MRRPSLTAAVRRLAEHGLLNVAESRGERVATGIAEQRRGLTSLRQVPLERGDRAESPRSMALVAGCPSGGVSNRFSSYCSSRRQVSA